MRRLLRPFPPALWLRLAILWHWTLRRAWFVPLLGVFGPGVVLLAVLTFGVLSISPQRTMDTGSGMQVHAGIPFLEVEGAGSLVCVSSRSAKILPPFLDPTRAP